MDFTYLKPSQQEVLHSTVPIKQVVLCPSDLPAPFPGRRKALPCCFPNNQAAKEQRTQEQIICCWELMKLHWSHWSYKDLNQDRIWARSCTEDNTDISREYLQAQRGGLALGGSAKTRRVCDDKQTLIVCKPQTWGSHTLSRYCCD